MNKHFRKVLDALKTNRDIKALGFSRKELKGVAAKVADKLELKEDATDDEVSEAISDAIDDVLPFLQLTQSVADRQVSDYKKAHPAAGDDEDPDNDGDPDNDEEPVPLSPSAKNRKGKKDSAGTDSAILAAIKELSNSVTSLQGDVTALKSGNTTNSRRAKVEKLLANTGRFGESQLKSFSRMAFKDDEEFEDYLEDLKEDIEAENQERANNGLKKLGNIPAPDHKPETEKDDKLMSDDEVKKLAKM